MDVFLGVIGTLGFFFSVFFLIFLAAKKKPKKIGIIMIIISLICFSIGIALPDSKKDVEKAKIESEEVDENGWTKQDKENFRVITQLSLNNYIGGYDTPSLNGWIFEKYEGDNVMAKTKVELKDGNKVLLICYFTYNKKEASGQVHFLSVGGNFLIDDGEIDNSVKSE